MIVNLSKDRVTIVSTTDISNVMLMSRNDAAAPVVFLKSFLTPFVLSLNLLLSSPSDTTSLRGCKEEMRSNNYSNLRSFSMTDLHVAVPFSYGYINMTVR